MKGRSFPTRFCEFPLRATRRLAAAAAVRGDDAREDHRLAAAAAAVCGDDAREDHRLAAAAAVCGDGERDLAAAGDELLRGVARYGQHRFEFTNFVPLRLLADSLSRG